MSFLETALKDGNLGSPEICKFVLKDPAAAPSYAADPVMAGFKIAATRADIDGTVANGSPAAAMLLAARRHYFDVVRNTIVESSLYADEFVSQQVKISFRPHLLVKDNTPEDTTRQIVDLFNAFVPTADSDIEEYAKEQAKLLGIPLNTAVVVGSLVLTRQGAPTPDMRLVDNLKRFYRTGNGGRVFPDPKDPEGDPLNPDMDGLRLAPGSCSRS
ncbi:MAG: hypothetical protein IPO57_13060 [Rhodocyclales bacterium]|nr:hypothetical protein [Rhodocyclales bacterium]